MFSVLVAVTAQRLQIGPAVFTAQCSTSNPVVKFIQGHMTAESASSLPLVGSQRAVLHGVPYTCTNSLLSQPCATNDNLYPPLWSCSWTTADGAVFNTGLISASLSADTFGGELVGIGVYLECPVPNATFGLQHSSSGSTGTLQMQANMSVLHHGTGAGMLVPFESNSAPTFTFLVGMPSPPPPTPPPSFPPPPPSPSPAPPIGPFGGYIPVGTCMTYDNEISGGYLHATNSAWNYRNGVCSSGQSPMICLTDGDTNTQCDTDHGRGTHDDTAAFDFGELVSFSKICVWGTCCTSTTWGVRCDATSCSNCAPPHLPLSRPAPCHPPLIQRPIVAPSGGQLRWHQLAPRDKWQYQQPRRHWV